SSASRPPTRNGASAGLRARPRRSSKSEGGKDGRQPSGLMVRDASLRDAPHHEGGVYEFTMSNSPRRFVCAKLRTFSTTLFFEISAVGRPRARGTSVILRDLRILRPSRNEGRW